MAAKNEFVEYIVELLGPMGMARARAMFGGYGVYVNDLMIGLVADNVLYLRVDAEIRPDFEKKGLRPFVYEKNGREYPMSYYRPPPEALDNSDDLCRWARKSYGAALRKAGPKGPKSPRSKVQRPKSRSRA